MYGCSEGKKGNAGSPEVLSKQSGNLRPRYPPFGLDNAPTLGERTSHR